MKTIFFFISFFAILNCCAQTHGKIVLNNGQKIIVFTTTSMEADMGMGMQMKNVSSATNTIQVIGEDEKNYVLTNTINKLNMSVEAMGQTQSYDSEKEADKDSEIGKMLSKKLNVADTISFDKISGSTMSRGIKKNASPEAPENPLEGMMKAMGSNTNENIAADYAFFIIPAGKKPGESWTDSSTDQNMKTVKNYTFKSLDKHIATINLNGTLSGNTQTEMQGTAVDINMNTKTTGDIIVNTKTGQVSKRTILADINGTIDMMGQSMPVTSKTNSTFVYQ